MRMLCVNEIAVPKESFALDSRARRIGARSARNVCSLGRLMCEKQCEARFYSMFGISLVTSGRDAQPQNEVLYQLKKSTNKMCCGSNHKQMLYLYYSC